VRLYKNKVFHSQWNDNRPLSGGVWDLLFLPALFLPADSVKRILLLGVGGGAVIRQYLSFLSVEQIVGVELQQADAIQWVNSYRGPNFDIIIEDLFTEKAGEAVRVVEASEQWYRSLRKLLRPSGALIINFEDPAQLRASSAAYLAAIGKSAMRLNPSSFESGLTNCWRNIRKVVPPRRNSGYVV